MNGALAGVQTLYQLNNIAIFQSFNVSRMGHATLTGSLDLRACQCSQLTVFILLTLKTKAQRTTVNSNFLTIDIASCITQ